MTEVESFGAATDPRRIAAEKLAAGNGGTLGLTREQAEAVLAARGWTRPAETIAADQAGNATDPEVARLEKLLSQNPNASDAWKAMVNKMIADTAVVRARHLEMKAGAKKR
jgi:hypothetical protein